MLTRPRESNSGLRYGPTNTFVPVTKVRVKTQPAVSLSLGLGPTSEQLSPKEAGAWDTFARPFGSPRGFEYSG